MMTTTTEQRQRVQTYKQTASRVVDKEQAKAVRKIAVGAIVAQYGGLEMLGGSKQDLKLLTRKMLFATQQVQNWFINNKKTDGRYAEAFLQEFDGDKFLLLSELLVLLWSYDAESLSDILRLIQEAEQNPGTTQHTDDMADICDLLTQVDDIGAIKTNLRLVIQNQINKEKL